MDSNQGELKIIKPMFVKGIESTRTEVICIEDEDSYKDTCISDCKIENQEAGHVSFEGVIFKNVELRAALLNSLELTNVRFENCDLSNANLSGAIIHRTEFINCKLVGVNLSDAMLQNVYMEQCNGKFALMSLVQMKRVIFKESIFENSNFQNSHFAGVRFIKCNFRLCQMSGTSLSGIDFSDSNVEGLGIQLKDLAGAIVSPMQAVDFSRLLGLVIKQY